MCVCVWKFYSNNEQKDKKHTVALLLSCPSKNKLDPNLLFGSMVTCQIHALGVHDLGNKIKY